MYQLKEYQQRALEALSHYFRTVSATGDADMAFYQVTKEVFRRGVPYNPVQVDELRGLPYVCLRMPTGAGKTYVACHAVGTATKDLLQADRSLVLWLVPTKAILEQTLDALKDRSHPYRQAVADGVGSVRVMDISEALYLNRATLDTETVIIVSTIQSFRVEDTEGRKVYADAGALMDHFSDLPKEILNDLERRENGSLIHSLANVLRLRRPVVIVDEAHNARTELSFEVLARFRPSCIIELTATPDREKNPSNILHSVSAAELKAEEMIKLPIELTTKTEWKTLLSDAIGQRDQLEKVAKAEQAATGEYIRPILLLQAEATYKERESVNVDVVKSTLIKDFQIAEDEIAVATGTSDDLEGVDLLAPDCKVRYIITVQKLKEGWDCPFAYVLCSVSELKSTQAIEQIVGRILRMPHAKQKQHDALNRSYAFSVSRYVAEALNALKDVLVENGFERQEAETLVRAATQASRMQTGEPDLFSPPPPIVSVQIELDELPALDTLPEPTKKKTRFDATTGTLTFNGEMKDTDREALKEACTSAEAKNAVDHAYREAQVKAGVKVKAPVEEGKKLEVPKLLIKQGDLFEEFEKTHILERPWKLSACEATLPGFEIPSDTGQHGLIDIGEQGKVETRFIDTLHAQMTLLADEHGWTVAHLVSWLDRSFTHQDIPPSETSLYLTKLVHHLVDDRGFTLDQLVHHKYRLTRSVEKRVDEHRRSAHAKAYQEILGLDETASDLTVDPERCFSFPVHYPIPGGMIYEGNHVFTKHYYPLLADLNGEEEMCAQFIDQLPQVEYWVRNLERPRHAFWLQTSTDRFYPDFVCKLRDGRTLVVEYKGEDRWSNDDSKEKRTLGELWAQRSRDRCLFIMPKGKDFAAIRSLLAEPVGVDGAHVG